MTTTPTRPLRLLSLAWPLFVEQGLRISIGTVDTLMVSHISDNAVAALGVANQIIILFLILFNFIGIGSSVVITHHLGARDRAGADRIARAAIGVNTWIGLAASLLVAGLSRPILGLMQMPEALFDYALPFLTLMGGTLFLDAQSMAMSAVLRAHGHTREVMLVTGAQNVLNVIGNGLLLFGLFGFPQLGVTGVALSGVFSRLVCLGIMWALVKRQTGVRLALIDYVAFPRREVRRILRIGLPAAGENLSYWLAFMVMTTFIARLGETSLAASTYALQLMTWVIIFADAIGLGTEILIGHLIGKGDFDKAFHELLRSLRIGIALALVTSLALAATAGPMARSFSDDPSVVVLIVGVLRLGVVLEPGRVFNIVVINALRATGDARFPLIVGLCSMWGLWLPLAWWLGIELGMGLSGIWIAMCADEWLRGLLMYSRWKGRRWIGYAQQSRGHLSLDPDLPVP